MVGVVCVANVVREKHLCCAYMAQILTGVASFASLQSAAADTVLDASALLREATPPAATRRWHYRRGRRASGCCPFRSQLPFIDCSSAIFRSDGELGREVLGEESPFGSYVTDGRRFVSVDSRVFRNLGGPGDDAWSGLGARRGFAAEGGSIRGVAMTSPAGSADPRRNLGTSCGTRAVARGQP